LSINVRPTGILIENNRILLIKQYVTPTRGWSLPGGKLEFGETIEQCLIREWQEETGLDIKVKELLYITDRFYDAERHIVHISFLIERAGNNPGALEWTHVDPRPSKTSSELREIKMVPINELTDYGFTPTFQQLVEDGFPGKGSYKGDYYNLFGETRTYERR
jgi:mutator protein MutT